MKIIDPHLHLFDLTKGDYKWLKSDNAPFWSDKKVINKNFSVNDIHLTMPKTLAGFVHIEAGFDNEQPWREQQWLSDTIKHTPFSTVAFIDITADSADFTHQLIQLQTYSCVVGCRYILDDHACEILSLPQVITNLTTLTEHNLSFDVQMPLDDLNAVNELLKVLALLPTLTVIINHAGFPVALPQKNDVVSSLEVTQDFKAIIAWQNWQQAIQLVSRFENCSIKCSGWEMTDRQYENDWLKQVIEHCIVNFGINRVMLASNFPLCLFSRQSYEEYWCELLAVLTAIKYTDSERNALLHDNALRIYRLSK